MAQPTAVQQSQKNARLFNQMSWKHGEMADVATQAWQRSSRSQLPAADQSSWPAMARSSHRFNASASTA